MKAPQVRFFVPDLSPKDRLALKLLRPKILFIGESPHISEVEPEKLNDRRPLCGVAGRQWWSLLSESLEGEPNSDVSLGRLLQICSDYRIGVMNAVQYPMDPKVAKVFPAADPVKNLGFGKLTGEYSYKKFKTNEGVKKAIESLRERLQHESVKTARIHCLGNDAEWLVAHALDPNEAKIRVGEKIPHPSAWWRQGGSFGRTAREKLAHILN